MYIFVYGTLKRGRRANYLLANSRFLGEGSIEGYDMYLVVDFPAIVKGKGIVKGEVYEIDEETLKELDNYEGFPLLYDRVLESVNLYNGKEIEAYVYVYRNDTSELSKMDLNEDGMYEF